jgi:hypothetical protein
MKLEEAKEMLYSLYSEFCFKDEQDKTNAIAGLITPFTRGLYNSFSTRTPLICYMANRERAGKDFCAGITGITYEGQALEEPPIANSERLTNTNDEVRKKITAAMIQGRKRFHSSNNKGYINNAVLESVITATHWSDRILGKSEIASFDNELDFSLSANIETTLTPDLANRSIYVNLFLDIENPNDREFQRPNLHQWVKENRGLVLSSLYALIRNWVKKGKPKSSVPFASFPAWAEVCGGIMEAAKMGNPCKRSNNAFGITVDSETDDMKQLFEFIFEEHPDEFLTKKDIVEKLKDSDESMFGYYDFDKTSDYIKFAKKLEKYVGRILSEIQLLVKDNSVRASRREYKFCKYAPEKTIETHLSNNLGFGTVGIVGIVDDTAENATSKGILNYRKNPTNPTNYTKSKSTCFGKNIEIITPQKSDRQVQFLEAKECKNIKPEHTAEEVLEWIKNNPGKTLKDLYAVLGVGSLKFLNDYIVEKKVLIKDEKLEVYTK